MKLKEQISADFKEAFKKREEVRKSTLSVLNSEIKNKEIELGHQEKGLADKDVVEVIQKAVKQRRDSAEQFHSGGRDELAQKEEAEINVLQKYLPRQMEDSAIEEEAKKAIKNTGAESKADMGKVMGAVMKALKGKADGNKVKEIVEKLLG